jgi:hypothetical protein
MRNFSISIIHPQGYAHKEAFREVAETLQYGLRGIGHTARILENSVDSTVTNILLGAHLLNEDEGKTIPPGSIIYNLEQLGSAHLEDFYYELAGRYQIWDYSPVNIARWKERRCVLPPLPVEIGYVPELRRIPQNAPRDIDVLFYGSVNEHRLQVLRQLQNAGVCVHAVFGVYGKQRDALIARSKIVLNLHFYESKLFEAVRVSYLLANSKAVVSEVSPDIGEFANAVAVFPYEGLVEGCLRLLRDEAELRSLEERGFRWFSQRSAASILSRSILM